MSNSLLQQSLAVIVLYEKSAEESRCFHSLQPLLQQGLSLLLFDNSARARGGVTGAHYHHSTGNVGVSGAYNHAAQLAAEKEKSWLWLLDDDTQVDPGFLNAVAEMNQRDSASEVFAPLVFSAGHMLSPFSYVNSWPKRIDALEPGSYSLDDLRPINSGLFLSRRIFEETGGYRLNLPLDFSDIEFTDRLRKQQPFFTVVESHFEQGFSGDQKASLEQDLKRFQLFLTAGLRYAKLADRPTAVHLQLLRRALRLSITHRSPRFMGSLVKKSRL